MKSNNFSKKAAELLWPSLRDDILALIRAQVGPFGLIGVEISRSIDEKLKKATKDLHEMFEHKTRYSKQSLLEEVRTYATNVARSEARNVAANQSQQRRPSDKAVLAEIAQGLKGEVEKMVEQEVMVQLSSVVNLKDTVQNNTKLVNDLLRGMGEVEHCLDQHHLRINSAAEVASKYHEIERRLDQPNVNPHSLLALVKESVAQALSEKGSSGPSETKENETDQEFILRLAKRPSWASGKARLERIAGKIYAYENIEHRRKLFTPKNNPKEYPQKYGIDHGEPHTIRGILEGLDKLLLEGADDEALTDYLDREFLFGCWRGSLEGQDPQLLRNLRGIIVAAMQWSSEASLKCDGWFKRRDGTTALCVLKQGHADRCMEQSEESWPQVEEEFAPRGKEAEELRAGLEKLIGEAEPLYDEDGYMTENVVSAEVLQKLLDDVDARDSLAHLEKRDSLRDLLDKGKYTYWAKNFTDDQLAGVFWLVGEFSMRKSKDDFPTEGVRGAQRRAVAALRALANIRREPLGLDEVRRIIRNSQQPTRDMTQDKNGDPA